MKALLIADFHLHVRPQWRHEWNDKFIDHLLENEDTGLNELFLLGDVFEKKDNIECEAINQLLKLILNWRSGVIWVTGQHDSYVPYKCSLGQLGDLSSVKIVDREVYKHPLGEVYFVPFARTLDKYKELLGQVPDNARVFTHMPVKEALPGISVDAISVDEFKRFAYTISGDIHKYADYDNFSYVGAVSQRDWRDKEAQGRIAHWDMEYDNASKMKRIETNCPMHIKVDDVSEIPKEGEYIVKLTNAKQTTENLPENILGCSFGHVSDLQGVKIKKETRTKQQMVEEYTDKNKPKIDKDKVKEYGIANV